MTRRALAILIVPTAVLGVILIVTRGKTTSPPRSNGPFAYEAEAGTPNDAAAETRRDYAVLEAARNDIASPENPEHKYRVQRFGPGREIVIDDTTTRSLHFRSMIVEGDIVAESRNIDGLDLRKTAADVQADFRRRNRGASRSLADFRPTNPNIIVRDLSSICEDCDDFFERFDKQYPNAWGYVWAFLPGYSNDGTTAFVLFDGGPNGDHGLYWVYLLRRQGKRWIVQWRHLCPRS
jgi:hypothetical protein